MNQQKICPHCGAQLPDMASFCPHCAQSVTQRREFRPPRRLPRRVLRGALLVLVLGTLALSAYLYTRPKVYDNGAAEVIYTDDDGSYQLLLNYFGDRFQPMTDYSEELEEGTTSNKPSRLFINHVDTGVNAKEAFLRKVEAITVELLQGGDSPEPWQYTQPQASDYDLEAAAKMTVVAVGSDNGILCDGDNLLLYPAEQEKAFFDALKKEGVVLFEDKADVEAFGKVLFHDGHPVPELVGKDAPVIAKAAGFDIPADTKVMGLKIDAVGRANVLNKEIMGPVVVLKSYETFEEAVAMAIRNMEESGGIGHTAGIFSNDRKHIDYYAERIPVARVLVNQPTPDAWGPSTNGLSPAVSESCGTWGNNILCENVDYKHLINISKVALPLDVEVPAAEELFKD